MNVKVILGMIMITFSSNHSSAPSKSRICELDTNQKLNQQGKFRSANQGLNDEGRCCKEAQTLQRTPTLAATDWLLMRYASVATSKNKKLLKISNSSKMVILCYRFDIFCRTIFY